MGGIIAFLVITVILLFPIKVKVTMIYQDCLMHVYIFNKKLGIKEKVSEEKTTYRNFEIMKEKIKKILPKSIRTTLRILHKNRFKPRLSLECELNYGFEDAALTGISYGLLQSLSSVIYELSAMVFKIKNFKYTINPQFNNPMLNFRISSIISVNLVKIIYIVILLII